MRFDDSLATVLAADTVSAAGVQAAWRQLVDLAGRGRGDSDGLIERLDALRARVSLPVRVASARALATARPPVALVSFMAADDPAVAAPVLRAAALTDDDWATLLPRLSPTARAVLRHRRDLPAVVARGLESFGATDFVIGHDHAPEPSAASLPAARIGEPEPATDLAPSARASAPVAPPRFEIADLVARIDAFQQTRPTFDPVPAPDAPVDQFRFATDATGVIRWVDGVARGPLVGVTLARAGRQGVAVVEPGIAVAFSARIAWRGEHLELGGGGSAAGSWTLAALPSFERGRFVGYSGVARRAAPVAAAGASAQLRQLVHELRTPATAIAGFAELIGSELLGPVSAVYRDRAQLIERQAGELVGAIEDLDNAARLEGGALLLEPERVDVAALVTQAAAEVKAEAAARQVGLELSLAPAIAWADARAAARLSSRLLATLVSVAAPGERLRLGVTGRTRTVRLTITRPRALAAAGQDRLFALAPEPAGEGPLLGLAFSLQLFADLAAAMGGRFAVEVDRLTLRLPLAQATEVAGAGVQ